MSLDLELTASFLVIIDEWDFGRAAQELAVSAPTVTKRLQRLERDLGVRLLERDSSGLTGLTAAGMNFARAARPLLTQARAASRAAQADVAGTPANVLRLGVPSGNAADVQRLGIATIRPAALMEFPALRIAVVEIPFPLLTRCLLERHVDLLLTIAPVRHRAVESFPLPLTVARIGVVAKRHALAGAGEVHVEEFCEHALLYNPTAPEEWMRPFWFGDLRPIQDARLASTHVTHASRVLRDAVRGSCAMVTLANRGALPLGLETVTLTGAKPVRMHAARLSRDRRAQVRAYLEHLHSGPPREFT
jgi:DNA-binding transcriptional LysR family regulator